MKDLIIVPSSMTDSVINMLKGSSPFLFNTSVRTFDFALKTKGINKTELLLNAYQRVKKLDLPRIGTIIVLPLALESMVNFLDDLFNYGLSLEDLPKDTVLEKEIYKVLECIAPLVPKPTIPTSTRIKAPRDLLTHSMNDFIKCNNFEHLEVPHCLPHIVRYKVARNIRHEIEAVIQEIETHDVQNPVVALPNLKKHIPLIELILKRYGYPSTIQDRSVLLSIVQFKSLISFAYQPSISNLLAVLDSNALNLNHCADLSYYISHFEMTLDMCMEPFQFAKLSDNKTLQNLEKRINPSTLILQEYLTKVKQNSYLENIVYAYDILKTNTKINTAPLHQFLEENLINFDYETHEYLLHFVDKISIPGVQSSLVRFVDINDLPFDTCENLYVLDLNASTYPNISSNTGLIDEQYLSKVHGYPSLDVRNSYYLKQQSRFLNISNNLTLSYNITNYEGKSIEPSYPILTYCKERDIELEPWIITQKLYRPKRLHTLHTDLAKELYTHQGIIYGSVSSFESYTKDPMQYFIENGLKLREPELLSFDSRILGTLNHKIAENLEDFSSSLNWDDIFNSFPSHSLKLTMIKKRNDKLMALNHEVLKLISENTLFSPMKHESSFKDFAIHPNIILKGTIDRIDCTDKSLLIIDYKSSNKSLSLPDIIAGRQLQLLTYTIVATRLYNKMAMGAFYYNFSIPNQTKAFASYSKSKGIQINDKSDWELLLEDKKLSGWFFQKPIDEFMNYSHHSNLSFTKKGAISVRSVRDYTLVESHLKTIYDDIQRNMLSGVLDKTKIQMTLNKDTKFEKEKEKPAKGDENDDTI